MKRSLIIATLVVATGLANGTVKAETVSTSKNDSNAIKVKTDNTNIILVNGEEKALVRFLSKNAPAILTNRETTLFNNVLTTYNSNPIAFLNFSEKQKVEFNAAAEVFSKKLKKVKTIEATNWLYKVNQTVNTLNFVWSIGSQPEVIDINETIEAPVIMEISI